MDRKIGRYSLGGSSNKDVTDRNIRVAFYSRVSTKHEEQVSALENQLEWCQNLRLLHPNWIIPNTLLDTGGIYVDEGITGTQAKKRTAFLKAISDGESHVYDLLVVRDVSRFARNCEESLKYTHLLKKCGIEVFFYNDGIWSNDADGELRLGIMSILAQDESRRTSEKVRAGQAISRQNGKLYGTGNILGYDLVRGESNNTYVINEEQAETVRRIFELYTASEPDLGIKKISSMMVEEQRKNASGVVRWSADKISRILDNRTYAGYIGYNKSNCTDFLEHTRRKNAKTSIEYIKGDFPAIIDDSVWQMAQRKKDKNYAVVRKMISEGQEKEEVLWGKRPPKDKWVKKIRCSCNSSYKKFKWRTNQGTGEDCYGYQCNNIVLHRKRDFIEKQGLSGEGYCNVPSIAQWKLDFQLRLILEHIWKNPEKTVSSLLSTIQENYKECDEKSAEMETARLLREEERLKVRQKNLLDLMLDGTITKEQFSETQAELISKLANIKCQIDELTGRAELVKMAEDRESIIAEIRAGLEDSIELNTKFIDAELIDSIVDRVVPDENFCFKWYLNFSSEYSKEFDAREYANYGAIDVSFEQARAYRKSFGNFIRPNQWKDIHAEIYIKVS